MKRYRYYSVIWLFFHIAEAIIRDIGLRHVYSRGMSRAGNEYFRTIQRCQMTVITTGFMLN